MTEVLLRAVGYSGRVTTVGVVGGRRNSARSREREGSVLAASSNVAEHRVDTLWDASRVAAEVVAVPGPRGPVSCLFLDIPSITGNDLLIDTVAAIRSLTSVLMSPGRKMRAVIKSRALTQLQETLFHSAKVLENESGAEVCTTPPPPSSPPPPPQPCCRPLSPINNHSPCWRMRGGGIP